MDVTCANCREPWDQYHMRHDAIFDTDLGHSLAKIASNEGTPLSNRNYREALERDGWKFAGNSVLAIARCPACPKDDEPQSEEVKTRVMQRAVLADLLGDDEDGLASMLEDLDGFE